MGCDAGRDDEKPAHRVWVDAFELAAFQTTNAEYARFLKDTRHPQPSLGMIRILKSSAAGRRGVMV